MWAPNSFEWARCRRYKYELIAPPRSQQVHGNTIASRMVSPIVGYACGDANGSRRHILRKLSKR